MSTINKPPKMVKPEYELQEPIDVAVDRYAAFSPSTPDHMSTPPFKMVLWRDADFRRWRKQQQTAPERKEGTGSTKAAWA